jgi:hypothetical protein
VLLPVRAVESSAIDKDASESGVVVNMFKLNRVSQLYHEFQSAYMSQTVARASTTSH